MMEVKIMLESKVAASNLLRSLHSQYQLGHLCDVVVQAGREERQGSFHAHRVVLAACSAYFHKVFISQELVGGTQRPAAVFLRDVSLEDFAAFAEFAYTASAEVTHAQLPRLLQVATRLGCTDLEEACRVTVVTPPPPPDPPTGTVPPPPEGRTQNLDPGKCETVESNGDVTSPSHASRGQSVANQSRAGSDAAVALATKVVIRRMHCLETEEGGGAREKEVFRCEECAGAEFGSLRLFQAHARREHRARLVFRYACDLCPQVVATQQNLRQHRAAVHTSERAFACGVCGKHFKSPKDISDHARRVHVQKTPQQCPHCGKVLSSKAGLALHLRTHTGEKPYHCADCGLRFAQKSSYNTHTRSVHQGVKGRKSCSSAHWRRSGTRTDPGTAASGGEETPAEEEAGGREEEEGGGPGRGGDRLVTMDRDGDVRAEGGGMESEGEESRIGSVVHAGKGMGDEGGGPDQCEAEEEEEGGREEEDGEREEDEGGRDEEAGTESDNKDGVCKVSLGGIVGKPVANREERRGRGRGKPVPEGSGRGGGVLQCDRCERRFRARRVYARHYRQAHGGAGPGARPGEKPFRCETCGRGLGSRGAWREHRDCVHSDERRFACSTCGGTFKRQRDVRTHSARKHEGRGSRPLCSVCGRILSSRSALLFHMRTHTGEKPHHCAICNQRFAQPSQLKTHTRGHTGERPYICEVCGASFGDSGKLTTHRRTHTGQRLFQCDVCEKNFTSREYLKHHKVCHLGAKPFHCELCGKSFGLRSSYFQHCRVHSDTRPFFCELCGKSFTQQGALRRHQRIHTGEKPFKCKACERTFTDMSTLRRHVAVKGGWKTSRSLLSSTVHDKKAEWRTYVIDLTNKKEHNWSKIKVFGISTEDGCRGDAVSSLSAPIEQGSGDKNDESQLQL